MRQLSFFKYAYLVLAILFFVEFISNLGDNLIKSIICLLLCLLAVFIFFFRKKIQDRYKS
jgi:amino acid permease